MQKHFFLCKTNWTHRKRHTCKKIQSFRNHSDHRRDHRCHAFSKSIMLNEKCLWKKNDSDRDNSYSYTFNKLIKRTNHFRLFFWLHRFCLQCQFRYIWILSYFIKPRVTLSGNNKAAWHQFIAFTFCNLIGFTCQKRFIHLNFSGRYFRIGTHLIAGFKNYDIIYDKIFGIDHRSFSVSDNRGAGRIQHSQLIQYLFCSNLLNNSNQCICNNNRKKCQISERSHKTEQYCKHDKD